MRSQFLATFIETWGMMRDFFNQNIGTAGITIIVCLLAVVALCLFWSLCKEAIGKKKLVIKWWRLIFLIIDVVLLVYFCLMY